MATTEGCSMCENGTGTYFCTGCKKYFCNKDFHSHRGTLNNELDGCIQARNALEEKILKVNQQKDICSPLLLQIDEWQKATIEKVKQAAEQVRQQVIQIGNSKRTEITSEFEKLSQKLIQVKETQDFAEQNLIRLKQAIRRLNQDLKQLAQSPAIELHMEESHKVAWNRLIYVVDKTIYPAKQQYEQQKLGNQQFMEAHSSKQSDLSDNYRKQLLPYQQQLPRRPIKDVSPYQQQLRASKQDHLYAPVIPAPSNK